MTAATGGYVRQLATFTTESLAQLVGAPSHSPRGIAATRLSRDGTLLVAGCGLAILVLMLFVDAQGWRFFTSDLSSRDWGTERDYSFLIEEDGVKGQLCADSLMAAAR